ncbi:MAG TPA: hypothetical protein VMT24_06710 [Aggregatilineaceae bacterium]|nr:hypothetical protein [Aggregatilineaceae bacterium]
MLLFPVGNVLPISVLLAERVDAPQNLPPSLEKPVGPRRRAAEIQVTPRRVAQGKPLACPYIVRDLFAFPIRHPSQSVANRAPGSARLFEMLARRRVYYPMWREPNCTARRSCTGR